MTIIIYSKDNCSYCKMAKRWMISKNIAFTEHKVGYNGFTKEMLLKAVPTARTVPQIIVDGKLIGGWDDFCDWYLTIDNAS